MIDNHIDTYKIYDRKNNKFIIYEGPYESLKLDSLMILNRYTGKKDCKNIEIFENDIVKFKNSYYIVMYIEKENKFFICRSMGLEMIEINEIKSEFLDNLGSVCNKDIYNNCYIPYVLNSKDSSELDGAINKVIQCSVVETEQNFFDYYKEKIPVKLYEKKIDGLELIKGIKDQSLKDSMVKVYKRQSTDNLKYICEFRISKNITDMKNGFLAPGMLASDKYEFYIYNKTKLLQYPKDGTEFYYINFHGDSKKYEFKANDSLATSLYMSGNYDINPDAKKIKSMANIRKLNRQLELYKEKYDDTESTNNIMYYISYNKKHNNLNIENTNIMDLLPGVIYYNNIEILDGIINIIGKEKIIDAYNEYFKNN